MVHWGKFSQLQTSFLLVFFLTLAYPLMAPAADTQAPMAQPMAQMAVTKDANVLTLDEALLIALDNHPSLKAARERVAQQRAVLGQQMAAYYPTVINNNFYRTGTEAQTAGVTTYGSDSIVANIALNLTLYNFGKREGAVQAARDTLSATDFNYKTTIDGVILGVKQAYYVYLGSKAIVKVREDTVKSRDLLARQAQGFYDVGTRARIDVVRAEANLYTAQADLITAQNAVKIAWVTLKNAMGVRELPERPLVEEVTITTLPYTLDEAKEIAYASRPELKSFQAQLKAQDENIAVARRGHLPDLIFDSSFRRSGQSNLVERAGGVNGNNNPILHHLDTFPLGAGWQVQVTLNIPIFDGFRTTNRVDEALHSYYSIKAQEELQRQQVALDVEQSYLRVLEVSERLKANEAAAKAAQENLDLANGRYQVGVGNIIEVTDAQQLYTDAQTTYVRAQYDFKIADAQLTRAIGK
jgi:outer membrane protein